MIFKTLKMAPKDRNNANLYIHVEAANQIIIKIFSFISSHFNAGIFKIFVTLNERPLQILVCNNPKAEKMYAPGISSHLAAYIISPLVALQVDPGESS
jgi:hypothetical protein